MKREKREKREKRKPLQLYLLPERIRRVSNENKKCELLYLFLLQLYTYSVLYIEQS